MLLAESWLLIADCVKALDPGIPF